MTAILSLNQTYENFTLPPYQYRPTIIFRPTKNEIQRIIDNQGLIHVKIDGNATYNGDWWGNAYVFKNGAYLLVLKCTWEGYVPSNKLGKIEVLEDGLNYAPDPLLYTVGLF